MLYMKEDDMDDMLRRAAENYEVDANKAADWHSIYTAVHDKPELKPVEEKKKRRFAFWWLLLIPLGWIANTEYNKFHNAATEKNKTAVSQETTPTTSKSLSDDKKSSSETNTIKEDKTKTVTPALFQTSNKNARAKYNEQWISDDDLNAAVTSLQQLQQEISINQPLEKNVKVYSNENTGIKQSQIQQPAINQQKSDLTNINSSVQQQQSNAVPATVTANKNQQTKQHYFYTGLLAGGDLSFVKYQKIQAAGYNIGVLAGYKFNKLSIETGLFLDKKNYYTNGEYFDKSKVPFLNNAKVLTVKGYCRMYEIPLNIKYNFSEKKKHTWFAAAGLSSYLMNKEFYHYSYKKDGVNNYGSYPYFHTTKNWFSVVNLSAGYELKTGMKNSLRIEPYFKTTVTGVGTGNLLISSAGINVGITRQIP